MMIGLNALIDWAGRADTDRLDPMQAGANWRWIFVSPAMTCPANQEFLLALLNPAPIFVSIANRPGKARDSVRKVLATTHGNRESFQRRRRP